MKKFIIILISALIFSCLSLCAAAHPGKTDENGAHTDSSTGEYHYHHGYPAHQHIDDICPYKNGEVTTVEQTASSAKDSAEETVSKKKYDSVKKELENCEQENEILCIQLSETEENLDKANEKIKELEQKVLSFGIVPLIVSFICAVLAFSAVIFGTLSNKRLKEQNRILRDKIITFKL